MSILRERAPGCKACVCKADGPGLLSMQENPSVDEILPGAPVKEQARTHFCVEARWYREVYTSPLQYGAEFFLSPEKSIRWRIESP